MNKQQLLNVLLEAQTKCKNFYFQCYSVTLSKEEIDYLVGKLSEDARQKCKYSLVVNKDGKEFTRIKCPSIANAFDKSLELQAELEKQYKWCIETKEKRKEVIMYITTHKEHPYGDY